MTASFVIAPCPGQSNAIACVDQPATIYTTEWPLTRNIRNHELGHVIDFEVLTNADRGTFEYLTHQNRPWVATLKIRTARRSSSRRRSGCAPGRCDSRTATRSTVTNRT
jgi:hypothetical protein